MEQEQEHQWTLHVHEEEEEEEEVEEADLERRKLLPHSNGSGVSTVANDPNESLVVQKEEDEEHEEIGSVVVGGENGNHLYNSEKSDFGVVGLGIVAEFVGEAATNGKSVNTDAAALGNNSSVYFDKKQGNEANGVQNGDSARSINPTNHAEWEIDEQARDVVISSSLCNKDNNQHIKTVDVKVPSSSNLSHLHNSSDIHATSVMNFDNETSTKEGPDFIEEIDHQLKDYDVEAVLAKQETHDLFCPNCHSCITNRVILKKRKRNTHNVDNKTKRDKLNAVVIPKPLDAQEAIQGDQENVTPDIVSVEQSDGNLDPEREPEVFRCLSCFSFFIPTGKRFNLFHKDGGARESQISQNPSIVPAAASTLQNPSNVPSSNANCFSLFTSNKGKTSGDASIEHSRTGTAVQHHLTPISSNMQTSPDIGHHPEGPLADRDIVKNIKHMPYTDNGHEGLNSLNSSPVESVTTEPSVENDMKSNMASGNEPLADQNGSLFQNDSSSIPANTEYAGDAKSRDGEKKNDSTKITRTNDVKDMSSVSYSGEMALKHDSVQLATAAATSEVLVNGGKPAKDAILNPYEGKPGLVVSTTVESPIIDKSPKGADKTPETVRQNYSSLKQGTQSPVQSFGSVVLASEVASNEQSSVIGAKQDVKLTEKVHKDIEEEINPSDRKEKKGGDVIVFVEGGGIVSTISQTADNVPVGGAIMTESRNQTRVSEQLTEEIGEPQQWEVIKSIVYGGLVESITSLVIVSSAAGSGTAPLNIIALGLANLVGGLFILGHNLSELKDDHSRGDQQQANNQYQELLGRRENFLLHAIVAVLSFLTFGSIPLAIYGLLIGKNYYVEVKLAAVAAASLGCIVLLAIGKVYTKRPPKSYIKTVSYYVTLAIGASGVSYIAGNLIKDLLEKFNHSSESSFAIAMPISDNGIVPKWMS